MCITCLTDDNRSSVAPACDCDDGYHDNGTICRVCSHECDTCDDHITNDANCLTCSDTNRSNAPACGCNDTFYDDGLNSTCKACVHPCLHCSDADTCT